ncbi:MAG: M56 family metallopeptidase [Phycisphaerales bacterium]
MSLLENLLSHGAIVRLGWMLVHFLWQAGVIAVLLAVLLRLLRRASANLRYLVACGALALTVAMPLVTMQFIDIPGPVAETSPLSETLTPTVTPTPMTLQLVDELPPLSSAPPLEEADLTMPIPWHERLATVLEPALPYLVLGWLAGVFGLSAWHLGGWAQLQRLKRRMVRDAGGALSTTLDELATRLGVRRAVTLLESALVEVPTVVGWLRPAILLPASALTGLNPDQLRAILAHELAHIHRYDYLANIAQTVVEILGFYHPAVWWVSHHIRIERENCCDDMAVRVCDNSLQYARALASMEEIRHSRSDLAMAASGGSLMARIARLLGRPAVDDRHFTWLPGLIALLLVVGVVIPAALALTQPAARGPEPLVDTVSAPVNPAQNTADPTQVLMNFYVFPKISPEKAVDRETRLLLAGVLTAENTDALREVIHADAERSVTLGELLQTWIAGKPMAMETMELLIDALQSRGYLEGEGRLEAMANNNQQAQIIVGAEEISLPSPDPASPPKTVKLGTFIQVTPRLSSPADSYTTLDIAAQWRERANPDDAGNMSAVHATEMASTVTIPNGQCQALIATNAGDPDAGMRLLWIGPPAVIQPTTSPDPIATPQSGAPTPDEPARTQVLLAFTVLDVVSDRTLDPDTAAQVRHCLARIPPADGGTVPTSTAPLLAEELVLPLRDVFAQFTPIPEKSKDFTDLLISRGYATVLSKPMILTFTDEPATLSWGEPDDPNAAYGYMRLTATAHVLDDRNATRLEIDYLDRRAMGDSNDPNRPISSTQIASTLVVSNDQYAAIVGMNAGTPGASMRMLLIGPTKVYRPQRAAGQNLNATEQAIVKTRAQNSTEDRDQTQVLIDFIVAKALTESVPDRETLSRIGEILSAERPQIAQELAGERKTTLGEVLRKYVASQSLSQETGQALIDLLQARGLMKIRLSPQVSAGDGQQFEIRNVSDEQFFLRSSQKTDATTQTQLQKVEYGTWIKGTPHVENDKNITLKMAVRVATPGPQGQSPDLPVVQTQSVESTMTVADNRCFSLLVEPVSKDAVDVNELAGLLVMFKPKTEENPSGPANPLLVQSEPAVSHRPQVLLDIRVVEIPPDRLRNLDVKWDSPVSQAGQAATGVDWAGAFTMGYSPDETFTNSLMIKLRQLEAANQVKVASNRRVLTVDGCPARLQSVQEEWLLIGGDEDSELQDITSGTTLDFTPHVGDSSEITLEVTVETSKSHPQNGGASGLPIVTRRQAKSKVTIQDGGTIALAGLVENPGGQSGPPAKTVVVFATASIVSETGALSQPRSTVSQKTQTQIRPKMTETRHLRLNHQTPQRVKDGLPSEYQEYVNVEDAGTSDLSNSGRFLTITAPATTADTIMGMIRKLDAPPRQVLLDARVVEIDRGSMAKLGIEWDRSTVRGGRFNNDSWPRSIQIGHCRDSALVDSLMKTLNQLESADRAREMANPQIAVPNRRETQLRTIQGEWFMMNAPDPNSLVDGAELEKLPCAAILSIVPRIGDSNEITLEMAISVSDSFPNGEAADLPLDGRPRNRNPVTVQDGGTVVLAGFPTKPAGQHGPPTKEIAIFATAHLIPQASVIPGPAASQQPAATKPAGVPITARFEGVDLREALRDLADNAGVPIVVDLNVHGRVSARIENLDLEKAMDIVLAGTPYTFKRMQSCYLVGDFYPIRIDYRRP